jgi:hypothetical protein
MAMIKGWTDDSRRDDRGVWAVGGFVGNDLQWEYFEEHWPKVMAKHGVPYFHMKEMGDPNGVYRKWHPAKEHYDEVAAFFADMILVISYCWLRPVFSLTRMADLNRFNAETGQLLEPYPLAAYGCMLGAAKQYDHPTEVPIIELVFDHVEKVSSKLAVAAQYAEADDYYNHIRDMIIPVPLPKTLTWREIKPLQAADLLIWEVQRNHLNVEEWFLLQDKPHEAEERTRHMDWWSLQKYGAIRPPARKSMQSLADNAAPAIGIFWDHDNLSDAHRLRGGRWS